MMTWGEFATREPELAPFGAGRLTAAPASARPAALVDRQLMGRASLVARGPALLDGREVGWALLEVGGHALFEISCRKRLSHQNVSVGRGSGKRLVAVPPYLPLHRRHRARR